ncbi:17958_t:CDS:1, partial [Acaulospora morrowiae]
SLQPPPHDSRQPLFMHQDSVNNEPTELLESSGRPQLIINSEDKKMLSDEPFASFDSGVESLERQLTTDQDYFGDSNQMPRNAISSEESRTRSIGVTPFPSFDGSMPLDLQNNIHGRKTDPSNTNEPQSVENLNLCEFKKTNSASQEQLVPAISFEFRSSQQSSL